jgi:signal transduction histidine kinase
MKRILSGCLMVALVSSAVGQPAGGVASIRSIRGLPDDQLRQRPAVTLRGTVTFHEARSGLTYIEDGESGIELRGLPANSGLKPGMRLELSGHVDESRPIPGVVVSPDSLKPGEHASLPPGVPLGAEQIRTGELDGRRVTMEASIFGIETAAERGDPPWLRFNVATPSGHFSWLMPWSADQPLPNDKLHARVRCVGVCEAIYNNRGQRIGQLLLVGGLGDLTIIKPPLADPFDRPTRSLAELARPGLDDPYDRIRVEGVVLCQQYGEKSNLVHLRTPQGAMQVETVEGDFQIGDHLAVVGYPVLANKHVVLRESVARRLGREPEPQPLDMTVDELLLTGSDSDLVRIRGAVLRNGLEAASGGLFIESANKVVEIVLSTSFPLTERQRLAHTLLPGSLLEVTGVAELRGMMLTTGTVSLTDMRLTLRTPADVVIRRAPPWWTTGRLLALAGGLAAVLALSAAWVFSLRRRVVAQTEIIRDKVGRETRWVERSRIARDIHDDVGSALTQITLLGDLGRRGGNDPAQTDEQFERISRQAREAVRALDAIVWTVNPKNDTLAVTVSYLCQMVQDLTRDTDMRCRLEIPDEIPAVQLGARARHNLLLAVKEAVHNAIKHSAARVLRLRMEFGPDDWRVEVADDGCGFEIAAADVTRTGLESMRHRMADIEGRLELESSPGQGVRVEFVLPWQAVK